MPLTPEAISQRLQELTTAHQRQLDKAGQPAYDPKLTELLKKDLDWLLDLQDKMKEELDLGIATREILD
jgi:DNA phosphorothioation-dependent restriction protein DptG